MTSRTVCRGFVLATCLRILGETFGFAVRGPNFRCFVGKNQRKKSFATQTPVVCRQQTERSHTARMQREIFGWASISEGWCDIKTDNCVFFRRETYFRRARVP